MATQKITPFARQNLEFFEAFDAVRAAGKQLPTNADFDELLKGRDYKRFSPDGDYWCGTWILYPAAGAVLGRGDLSDSSLSHTLEAKYIPKSAIGKEHVAVLFEMQDRKEKDGTTYIIPIKGTVRVQSFPDDDGWYGYDPITRVPINAPPQGNGAWDKRYCYRRDEQTLRPLVRWDDDWDGYDGRRDVGSDGRLDYRRGVGVVEPQRKLKLADADAEVEETFNTVMPKDGKTSLRRGRFKAVKTGRRIEVTVRTL